MLAACKFYTTENENHHDGFHRCYMCSLAVAVLAQWLIRCLLVSLCLQIQTMTSAALLVLVGIVLSCGLQIWLLLPGSKNCMNDKEYQCWFDVFQHSSTFIC